MPPVRSHSLTQQGWGQFLGCLFEVRKEEPSVIKIPLPKRVARGQGSREVPPSQTRSEAVGRPRNGLARLPETHTHLSQARSRRLAAFTCPVPPTARQPPGFGGCSPACPPPPRGSSAGFPPPSPSPQTHSSERMFAQSNEFTVKQTELLFGGYTRPWAFCAFPAPGG